MTKQRRYTAEFKAEAIKQVVDRNYSIKDVSERLRGSTHSLYAWCHHDSNTGSSRRWSGSLRDDSAIRDHRAHQYRTVVMWWCRLQS